MTFLGSKGKNANVLIYVLSVLKMGRCLKYLRSKIDLRNFQKYLAVKPVTPISIYFRNVFANTVKPLIVPAG